MIHNIKKLMPLCVLSAAVVFSPVAKTPALALEPLSLQIEPF